MQTESNTKGVLYVIEDPFELDKGDEATQLRKRKFLKEILEYYKKLNNGKEREG